MNESMRISDFRSDTITRPDEAMRRIMAEAPVGDDVFGEDPSIQELESTVARLLGKEAALFVPSGTMANQIAVRVYGRPGNEIAAMDETHVFFYEGAGAAGISGVQLRLVPLHAGLFHIEDFECRIRAEDPHFPVTCALWIENTHNRGGGRIIPFELVKELYQMAGSRGIPLHVDGARLMNASVATGIPMDRWASCCDSVSICFSKGLGAPVGSALAGTREFIRHSLRARKTLGGGMRQAGIIAAGALYAIRNNLDRLAEDHRRAKSLRTRLESVPGLSFPFPVETNMVMIDIDPRMKADAPEVERRLAERNVRMLAISPRRIRAVTHLDITDHDVDWAVAAFRDIFNPDA